MNILHTTKIVNNLILMMLTLVSSILISGCSNGLELLDKDSGKSVNYMVQNQIYDKAAAQNPSPNAPEGIGGDKAIADLHQLDRPRDAEKEMLNYIKLKKFEVGK